MLFGLLNDDTQLQDDPMKMALYGAADSIQRTDPQNIGQFLKGAIEGAGQGYTAYKQYQQGLTATQDERTKAALENAYKLAQLKKLQYDMGADQRADRKLQRMRQQVQALGLPEDQASILMAMNANDLSSELGEIRNERATRKTTTVALQKFMSDRQFDEVTQAAAMETYANAKTGSEGYAAALRFLKDSGAYAKKGTGAATLDGSTYAKTLGPMVWDTDDAVKNMAIKIVETTGDVGKAESFIESAKSRIKPEETDTVKMNASGVITLKGFKGVKGNDQLWYNPQTGERLPGGQKYKMAADGSGLVQKDPDKDERTQLKALGMGLRSTAGLAKLIYDEAETLGVAGMNVALERVLRPETLSKLGTKYILVLMDLKEKFTLGAITGPDMAILSQAINNPMEFLRSTNAQSFLNQIAGIQEQMFYEFDVAARSQNYDPNELWTNTYSEDTTTFSPFEPISVQGKAGRTGADVRQDRIIQSEEELQFLEQQRQMQGQ